MNVSSCSTVGLRNSGAVSRMNSFQNAPGPASASDRRRPRPAPGEVDEVLLEAERRELAAHDASAANTTRCPRCSSTLPSPMHWFVGPYADSGMNRIVSGRSVIGPSLGLEARARAIGTARLSRELRRSVGRAAL